MDSEDELDYICLYFGDYYECFAKFLHCETIGPLSYPGRYESIVSLLNDVCEKDTLFYKIVAKGLPCIKGALNDGKGNCGKSREKLMDAYKNYVEGKSEGNAGIFEGKGSEAILQQLDTIECLQDINRVSCVADYAATECTDLAKGAVVEIARRSQMVDDRCADEDIPLLFETVNQLDLKKPHKQSLLYTFQGLFMK
ncbi:uncharacterized protein LOC118191146 isoform X2 [Stegodyphus dumicola]|nr:uncharacterized protein LOC118191146 isoform X2 [Stegodyphus dumicola]XP_035217845.1 uncharacterized protein LOC118191146 isoform X2 [Stegodyphus dumicola]